MNMRKKYLMALLAITGITLAVLSCSKDEATNKVGSETISTANEIASTEMVEEEIFSSVNSAIALSERTLKSADITDCASISIKPLIGGYPKTITIDFGSGCTGTYGLNRSGIISFTISDSLRTAGAKLSVSFNSFAVNGFSVNGTMSFKNTSTSAVPAFYQETDLVMKTSKGTTITKTKTADRQWISGSNTPDNITDDVFQITSNADVSSSSEGSYSYTVKEPLVIAASCDMFKEGVIEITTSAKTDPVTIDFGDGECDLKVFLTEKASGAEKEVVLTK